MVCVNWTPEIWFKNETIDVIEGAINKERFDLKCGRCRVSEGSCIQCDYKSCSTSYHVRCAIRMGRIECWDKMHNKIGNDEAEWLPVFCAGHDRVGNFKFKIKGREGIDCPTKKCVENAKRVTRRKPVESKIISIQDAVGLRELTDKKSVKSGGKSLKPKKYATSKTIS